MSHILMEMVVLERHDIKASVEEHEFYALNNIQYLFEFIVYG